MARLTIEDCWWTDPRREKLGALVGGMVQADGLAIRMWRVSQEYWGRGRLPIPKDIFDSLEAAPKLIQAGLARVENDGVYVNGSSQYVDWLNEKRANASAGGKKSAKRPRNAKGQLTKTSKQKPSTDQAEPKIVQPSGFGSGSGFGELESPSEISAPALPAVIPFEKVNPVALWCSLYKFYLGNFPELLKEDTGKLMNFGKNRSADKLRTLFSCYFQIQKKYYQERGYSVGVFFSDLQVINNAAGSGIDPSKPKPFDYSKLAD